jgi:pimeloyl-ACP methyl ester carboxylesterase
MRSVYAAGGLFALLFAGVTSGAEPVSFATQDGGMVHALVHGKGQRGVVLAHGGRFNKESWQHQAELLAKAGFRVVAFDFRENGTARHLDVLGAISYLRNSGANSIAVVGASMGGDYAAEACEVQPNNRIDRLVLIAAGAYTTLKNCQAQKLYIMSRDDVIGDDRRPRMPPIRKKYEEASGPKQFIVLEGAAHAQEIFASDQGARLTQEILRFLSAATGATQTAVRK